MRDNKLNGISYFYCNENLLILEIVEDQLKFMDHFPHQIERIIKLLKNSTLFLAMSLEQTYLEQNIEKLTKIPAKSTIVGYLAVIYHTIKCIPVSEKKTIMNYNEDHLTKYNEGYIVSICVEPEYRRKKNRTQSTALCSSDIFHISLYHSTKSAYST